MTNRESLEKPMSITDRYWIFSEKNRVCNSNREYDVGKWMLFYDCGLMDDKWCEILELFNRGDLSGIVRMKCSTAYKNPRSSSATSGVIILYAYNAPDILEIGQNIVERIDANDVNGMYMYYKLDEQTRQGTRATGKKNNHVYKIQLEKVCPSVKMYFPPTFEYLM
jgi:hypothetical protein